MTFIGAATHVLSSGTHRIFAEGLSNAGPEIQLALDEGVLINDDRSAHDRNSEIIAALRAGSYKLAVRAWRNAAGAVRVSVQGPR
jgi:hypothetical protein